MLVSVVFYVGAFFGNLRMVLDYIIFVVGFTNCILGTRLSIQFQHVSVDVPISISVVRCCHRFFVVVIVDRVLIFVGDRHVLSQPVSSLQCQVRVCARIGDCFFLVLALDLCGIRLIRF